MANPDRRRGNLLANASWRLVSVLVAVLAGAVLLGTLYAFAIATELVLILVGVIVVAGLFLGFIFG